MEFRIADTFTDSLARLTPQEQRAAKITAFDLQMDPSRPGLSFHRVERSKDPNFWSIRVNDDLRVIVHRTPSSFLLAYVAHHDAAYRWSERRKLAPHPTTGAMQLVEIRELVEEIRLPRPSPAAAAAGKPKLFDNLRKGELMGFGVPEDWVDAVREATEDTLFDVLDHLPGEAQEALLSLVADGQPVSAPIISDPFAHPDAQRRFRTLANREELERALDFPWEKWTVFLHPAQRQHVEREYSGPARISGSAGTGKTIVALHRALWLARRHPEAKVLVTTFSKPLAAALKRKLSRLIGNEPAIADRIVVMAAKEVGYSLHKEIFDEQPNIVSSAVLRSAFSRAVAAGSSEGAVSFPERFLLGEWDEVVDAWQLTTWEAYRDVSRLGRKTRIGGKQREALWTIFERVRADLAERKMTTWAGVFGRLTGHMTGSRAPRPYEFVIVDEAQDLGIAEARFFAALGSGRPDALFFTGDLGQRIFQQPYSWRSLGIDIRGRSHTLRINYRTSHQIRLHADRLLPSVIADVDGNEESRHGTISVFDGPEPVVSVFSGAEAEQAAVGGWIADRLKEGCLPPEIGVIVRSEDQMKRARAAVKAAGVASAELTGKTEAPAGHVALATMPLAKGLEFRAVAVMACDDDVLPQQSRIEGVFDDSDLEEIYDTERHLLYVACTRARDNLMVTGIEPGSEFIQDFTRRPRDR